MTWSCVCVCLPLIEMLTTAAQIKQCNMLLKKEVKVHKRASLLLLLVVYPEDRGQAFVAELILLEFLHLMISIPQILACIS